MSYDEYYSPMEIVNKYYDKKWEVETIGEDVILEWEMPEPTKDAVNNPDHYNHGNIECIEYLKDNLPKEGYTGYLEGNFKKYLHRWRHKGKPIEDLKKARWYLDRLIKELE